MKTVKIGSSDVFVPAIGQGTWRMGSDPQHVNNDIDTLRAGFESGLTLVDTAEKYSTGEAEKVVGEATKDCRNDVFITTKVYPTNGSYDAVLKAAEGSLKRLQTDYIDLYLLHWPSATYTVAETMRAMRKLLDDGLIRFVGVSNFDISLMQEADIALGGPTIACNQMGFHLNDRVIEKTILPYCETEKVTLMAYSPLGGARKFPAPETPERRALDEIGEKHGADAYQIALAWNISRGNIVAIPKTQKPERARSNAQVLSIVLDEDDHATIDKHFPIPENDYIVERQ